MPNTRGLGFWLKQLKSDTEASQSNLSTVANIDTDESLDGADSTYEADRGIEFSASENDANETTAENSSKPKKSEDSKEIGEKDGAEKYSNWQEPSKKNDIGDDESDDEPPDEQPIIKCKRYVIGKDLFRYGRNTPSNLSF